MGERASVGGSGDRTAALNQESETGLSSDSLALMMQRWTSLKVDAKDLGSAIRRMSPYDLELTTLLMRIDDGKKGIVVSDQVGKFLKEELGVKEKYIQGSRVHFELDKEKTKDFPGAPQLWFDKAVSFDIKAKPNRIEITNMKGVMVDPDWSPWVNVNSAIFVRHADGSCTASINAGRFGLSKTKTINISRSVYSKLEQTVKENVEPLEIGDFDAPVGSKKQFGIEPGSDSQQPFLHERVDGVQQPVFTEAGIPGVEFGLV